MPCMSAESLRCAYGIALFFGDFNCDIYKAKAGDDRLKVLFLIVPRNDIYDSPSFGRLLYVQANM